MTTTASSRPETPRTAGPLALAARGAGLLLAAVLLVAAALPADASNAVLTKSGTLYEVYRTTWGAIVPAAAVGPNGRWPVLALRTTLPGAAPTVEIVEGTIDDNDEGTESVDFDETTGTVFVLLTKFQGLMSDVHVAVRRDTRWEEQNILPNVGLYLSLNPRMVVTRQDFVDFDGKGGTVTKSRSIVSIIWWEESGPSQARYASVFVEDGVLRLSDVVAYNLNAMAGSTGSTIAPADMPLSAYTFPVLQRDPSTNGGVVVSFANFLTQTQTVLQITFPDDITKLAPPGATSGTPDLYARAHLPIGRDIGHGHIPMAANVPGNGTLDGVISPRGDTTFYWQDGATLNVLGSDAAPDATPLAIPLRPDFSIDRAVALVRDMATKN